MEKYRVIKDILQGKTLRNPNYDSQKVIAKAGTILIAKNNPKKIGNPLELFTTGGRFICQVGSTKEKEYCIKITDDIPVNTGSPASLEENLFIVFKEHLDSQNQSYDDEASLEHLVELVKKSNSSSPTLAIGGLFEVALKRSKTD